MGKLGVAQKIIYEDHEAKLLLEQFIEISETLRSISYFPECLK